MTLYRVNEKSVVSSAQMRNPNCKSCFFWIREELITLAGCHIRWQKTDGAGYAVSLEYLEL